MSSYGIPAGETVNHENAKLEIQTFLTVTLQKDISLIVTAMVKSSTFADVKAIQGTSHFLLHWFNSFLL